MVQIGAKGCAVTAIVHRDEVTLIDAGARGSLPLISRGLEAAGLHLSRVRHVVLTHYHPDHSGGLGELVRATGARVAAHSTEADIYTGQGLAPNPFRWRPYAVAARPFLRYAYGNPVEIDWRLGDGDRLPWLDGIDVIHVPGHTAGSISLYVRAHRALVVGDALQFRFGRLTGPASAVTRDPALALLSIRKLLAVDFDTICFSHFRPLSQGAAAFVRRFVERSSRAEPPTAREI
ncbi:MAG: MBL fold metallo-hydrolase [Chloroflexi bacterium]|nr:MBL fold metallo-hydrolase [Chloroflexota bacterium]